MMGVYISWPVPPVLIVKLGSTTTGHDSLNVQRASILLAHCYSSCTAVPMLPERVTRVVPARAWLQLVPSYCMSFSSRTFVASFCPLHNHFARWEPPWFVVWLAWIVACMSLLSCMGSWTLLIYTEILITIRADCQCEILRMAWNQGCVLNWVLRKVVTINTFQVNVLVSAWGNGSSWLLL